MARFIVMEPPGRPDDAEFIRDGFSLAALLLPPVWLVRHRLFAPAILFVALCALASVAGARFGSPVIAVLPYAAGALALALEGAGLRRRMRVLQGWREAGILHAATLGEAEIRWFAARPEAAPEIAPVIAKASASRPADAAEAAAFAFPARG